MFTVIGSEEEYESKYYIYINMKTIQEIHIKQMWALMPLTKSLEIQKTNAVYSKSPL